MPVLSVENLRVGFNYAEGYGNAVDDVSFSLAANECLGIVGESGCGKSVTALSILRLVQEPPGKIAGGRIFFEGEDILAMDHESLRKIRGGKIAMIFQDPMTALNPVFTIGSQIAEAVAIHTNLSRAQTRERAVEMLQKVGMPDPEQKANEYPHQLSGGMRQRAMIAMALANGPSVLIADEPTTALDVTIQAQILDLIEGLKAKSDMSVILITHDLGVVAKYAQKVAVMYAGKIVEYCSVSSIFANPMHPYTVGLMESIPAMRNIKGGGRLREIPGIVPPLYAMPAGCRFNPRCPRVMDICKLKEPPLVTTSADHLAACHLHPEIKSAG
ncbi:MAG: ABC transporter ATP-binding protein [Nitrospinae bacterium]|nr:ABC transporter ATP-binding protein [Nitrospinota bacterium]